MSSTPIRTAIVTVSDGVSAGERVDHGGPACEEALREAGVPHAIVAREGERVALEPFLAEQRVAAE